MTECEYTGSADDPTHLEARLLAGDIYLELSDGPSAEKEFSKAIRHDAQSPTIKLRLFRAMLLKGRYDDVAGRLLALDPETMGNDFYLIRGQARLSAGSYELAREDFNHVRALAPDNTEALKGLTRLALATQDLNEAKHQIVQALSLSDADLEALVLKAEVLLSTLEYDAAEKGFLNVLERNKGHLLALIGLIRSLLGQEKADAALLQSDILAKANPQSALGSYLSALAFRQKGDLASMQLALHEVLKVAPDHPNTLLMLGVIHYHNEEFEIAKNLLSRFVQLQPIDLRGGKYLSATLIKLGEIDEGIAQLNKALESNADDPQLIALLGNAYLMNNDAANAKSYLTKATELKPNASGLRTQLALSHFAAGDIEQGMDELQSVIATDPTFVRADYLLMLVYLRKQEFRQALALAEKLAVSQPQNPSTQNSIAAAHEGMGDLAKARTFYEFALKIHPDYVTAKLNLARLDIQAGEFQTAETRYNEVLSDRPDSVVALNGMARIALRAGNTDNAIQQLERARAVSNTEINARVLLAKLYLETNPPLALTIAEEAYAATPHNPSALEVLARSQLRNGEFEKAKNNYAALAANKPLSANRHYLLGIAQAGTGDHQAASDSWNKALEINPKHLNSSVALTRLAMSREELDSALKSAKIIQAKAPSTPIGWILEGDILVQQNDSFSALIAYKAAQAITSRRVIVTKIVTIHQRAGDTEDAIKIMTSWLEHHPDDVAIRVTLATLYHSTDNTEAALKHYNQVLSQQEDHAVVLNNVAWIYFDQQDERALETAQRAYQLVPDHAEVADTYGWFLIQDGQIEKGLNLLTRAAKRAPTNFDIRYHLAAGLILAGEESKGRGELEQILSHQQPFAERKSAKALLDSLK